MLRPFTFKREAHWLLVLVVLCRFWGCCLPSSFPGWHGMGGGR